MPTRTAARRYPIRAVARLTGLSVDTLRAWERRYGAVVPTRGDRGRMYGDADVDRLKQLAALVERGHAIGTVAHLSTDELTRLIDGAESHAARPDQAPAADLTALLRALGRYDLPGIEAALARHAAVLPTRELVFAVILPLLRELGDRWEAGTLSPAQEHLVSALVRSALGSLLRTIGTSPGSARVVFATPAGERHELCLLCAAVLAATAGFGVLYLGPDLPAGDIAHAVSASDASSVVLAATTAGAVTRAEAKQLARQLAGVDVWIGGPQAGALADDIGFGEQVATLDELVPRLARHRH
jgi:DNA-binding transcriptional MerR regulator/methylmalonyl-CoA mutase cobalamin-binding subunit